MAPNAYLGNYKVLTVPTENFGLNGNAPEIAAGVEAAVNDGMDIINLSLGEPEIEPSRDLVVAAINAAADAGVVPTIAAGNERDGWGNGSISSPGSALKAITAAAVSKQLAVASFSSAGPTPISLRDEARRERARTSTSRRPSRRTRAPGPRSAGRAWPRRTSPAQRRSCSSAIPTGRSRRSSPRSS